MGEEEEAIKTAFYDIQAAMGATFAPDGGWLWTDSFGDVEAEYRAVREGVGMWDVSPLNKWDFRGPDALKAAQRINSNDILGMLIGQVRYGPFLDEDGLVVDDGTVYKRAEDRVWVMTNGMELKDYFADATKGMDVEFEYVAFQMPHLAVQGPKSRDVLAPITSADISSLKYYRFFPDQIEVTRKVLAEIGAGVNVVSHEDPVHEGSIAAKMERSLSVIDRREESLRKFLLRPRTRDEIVARRIVYGEGRPGPWFDYGEWALLGKHLEGMVARGEAFVEEGRFALR